LAVVLVSKQAGIRPRVFWPQQWEIELHRWEHKYEFKYGRLPDLTQRHQRMEQLSNQLENHGQTRMEWDCPDCADFGVVEIRPRDYIKTETGEGREVYMGRESKTGLLAVWTPDTCRAALLSCTDHDEYLRRLKEWAEAQEGDMRQTWAKACYSVMVGVVLQQKSRESDEVLTLDDIFSEYT